MIYLLETKLPENKSVFFALNSVFGIGKKTSFLICKKLGFSLNLKVKNLSAKQASELLKIIDSSKLIAGTELKKIKLLNFKKLISIKSYKGLRKLKGYPVRGQRTHTNASTAKKLNKKF
jgi:small subunit ribosomal protein S13